MDLLYTLHIRIPLILLNYFIAQGYGQLSYSEAEIREIFKEMDALDLLFPRNGNNELVDLYSKWRDKHHAYWFKKWYTKPGRKLVQNGAA